MSWQPPPRASWVDKLAATGRALGDDGRSIVSLDPDELTAAAAATSGLHDFGDDWFREPLARLTSSIDEEASLHLAGRIRARAELQIILRNRLALVDLWKREPAVLEGHVAPPIVVTGLGRSGTTLLLDLLACDPANRPPLLWELLHSVPPPTRAADVDDERARWADDEITLLDEMVPSFTGMHESRGHWPTECIFAFMHQFSSDEFVGLYDGLGEAADIVFVLTTNRPDAIELRSLPGPGGWISRSRCRCRTRTAAVSCLISTVKVFSSTFATRRGSSRRPTVSHRLSSVKPCAEPHCELPSDASKSSVASSMLPSVADSPAARITSPRSATSQRSSSNASSRFSSRSLALRYRRPTSVSSARCTRRSTAGVTCSVPGGTSPDSIVNSIAPTANTSAAGVGSSPTTSSGAR